MIRETNIGEHDRLITVMTRDMGVISAYAAGAKSIKSKKGSATGLLSYSSFSILKKGDTYRIEEATPIKIFFGAGSNIVTLTLAQYFCELCAVLGPHDSNCEEFLRLILNSLHFITETDRNVELIKAITELRTMVISGYAPNLIACSGCGKFEDDFMYFKIDDGSLWCEDCKRDADCIRIEKTLLDAMRHIVYSPFERLYSFEINGSAAKKLSSLTEKYIIYQTEHSFKTIEFYNSIKSI